MKVAVISGGAGGLGLALADALEAQGWQAWLLDREVGHVQQSATRRVIACDLTDGGALAAACAQIVAAAGRVDLAVYNAAITHIGPFDGLDEVTHRRVFEINYFAAVAMARHLLAPLRAARGTHLAISSVAGFSPLHHRTAYAASKHALEGFFHSLRSEEAAHGVRVQVAAPSFVATNTGARANTDGTARPGAAADGVDYMTPADAAAEILRGLARGAPMIPVGRVARLAWRINRASPRLFQRLMERNIKG
ncbi:SDR family NAD(P)-dependent oxidoreductase [Lutimaribacter sp. EGI FJ00015]|uniref:SDR family NAD(P)-dependent oxidoreductase n=1 Tax=Lutimaribacter degradans TaxID=2945989 RepID=A0ACC5ZVZ3_9RHOB|nr:SDR family NAD(P)-dependent oxidoreductase [Lutimaribacter sp. EGI FJ00013]MCO0613430.1 SDR family NAD(P)-dependent oxidoreductase [Lutimaribacter sp. EGI FJ00015]MCO0636404.1 SDR family NAD(P)-dependent oxidoreductase [Lutimaribacter sp. EGI FJ00014]